MALGKGHVALLGLLDLSAAFDTVDHDVLLKRLGLIWCVWYTSQMEEVAYCRSYSTCDCQPVEIVDGQAELWYSPRIGVRTFIIRPVHQRHQRHHTASWSVESLLCRRYTGLFLLQA